VTTPIQQAAIEITDRILPLSRGELLAPCRRLTYARAGRPRAPFPDLAPSSWATVSAWSDLMYSFYSGTTGESGGGVGNRIAPYVRATRRRASRKRRRMRDARRRKATGGFGFVGGAW
jgi:hypothetical protein